MVKVTTVRFTEAEDALVKRLAEHIGVSRADVVRMGLRELARVKHAAAHKAFYEAIGARENEHDVRVRGVK